MTEMTLSEDKLRLLYPCPCGDLFEIMIEDIRAGESVAQCPTCSLTIQILYTAEERDAHLASLLS